MYSAEERKADFEPLPPLLVRREVMAGDVRIGDWMVFSPGHSMFSERRDWVPVEALEMARGQARFKAAGRETIEVPLGGRVRICRPLNICSVRKHDDGHSVDVCRWSAGHGGNHEWENEDEPEGAEDAVGS